MGPDQGDRCPISGGSSSARSGSGQLLDPGPSPHTAGSGCSVPPKKAGASLAPGPRTPAHSEQPVQTRLVKGGRAGQGEPLVPGCLREGSHGKAQMPAEARPLADGGRDGSDSAQGQGRRGHRGLEEAGSFLLQGLRSMALPAPDLRTPGLGAPRQ